MPKSNLFELKEELCSNLQCSLNSFTQPEDYNSLYRCISMLITRIQSADTEYGLKTIVESFIIYFGNTSKYKNIKEILEGYCANRPYELLPNKQELVQVIQKCCLVTSEPAKKSIDLTCWRSGKIYVNNAPLNFEDTRCLHTNAFNYYLSSADVPEVKHAFIAQVLAKPGIRTLADYYSNYISHHLRVNKINYEGLSQHNMNIDIQTLGTKIIVSQKIRFEYILEKQQLHGLTIVAQSTFETKHSMHSPWLVSFKIEECQPDAALTATENTFISKIFSQEEDVFTLPLTGSIKAGDAKIDCSAFIANLKHTGEMAMPINERYFFIALPNCMPEERYYLIDTGVVLGQGGYGKVFQAYQVSEEAPIVSESSPKFAAKKIFSVLYDPNEITYSQPHILIQGVIKINHDNTPCKNKRASLLDSSSHLVLMEYIPGEALSMEALNREQLNAHDRVRMVLQLALQIQSLHEITTRSKTTIVHCDLKDNNVLFYRDGKGRVNARVIDFGLAHVVEDKSTVESIAPHVNKDFMPHPNFSSPEMFDKQCGFSSDIYMLAPILATILGERDVMLNKRKYELANSVEICSHSPNKQKLAYVTTPLSYERVFSLPGFNQAHLKQSCIRFLHRMSSVGHKKRPKIGEVVQFFTGIKNELKTA